MGVEVAPSEPRRFGGSGPVERDMVPLFSGLSSLSFSFSGFSGLALVGLDWAFFGALLRLSPAKFEEDRE